MHHRRRPNYRRIQVLENDCPKPSTQPLSQHKSASQLIRAPDPEKVAESMYMHRLLAWMKTEYYGSVAAYLRHFESRLRFHDRLGHPLSEDAKILLLLRGMNGPYRALVQDWRDQHAAGQIASFGVLLVLVKEKFPDPDSEPTHVQQAPSPAQSSSQGRGQGREQVNMYIPEAVPDHMPGDIYENFPESTIVPEYMSEDIPAASSHEASYEETSEESGEICEDVSEDKPVHSPENSPENSPVYYSPMQSPMHESEQPPPLTPRWLPPVDSPASPVQSPGQSHELDPDESSFGEPV
ncbi:hypothetical protein SCUCBS95973_003073 [Sporothrix curviconia]|uniref:Uncharacterized protein n=1 Tax=Sporothrix curviconia TaxID=1260050 RepID=A0ABP0BC90_9PEZI